MKTPAPDSSRSPALVEVAPSEAGLSADRLAEARQWLEETSAGRPYRCVVMRNGLVAAQWSQGMPPDRKVGTASAAKSVYSNVLGIAVAEGKLASADELVVDYYPQMMDVREGQGNRPGRYAFEVNRGITFRHLITNTSGYMKPGEAPGKVFNYQSWGMNVLTHALATIYGLYDIDDPEGSPGFAQLIREKIAEPIGASFEYSLGSPEYNDRLARGARLDVFGYYTGIHTTAMDFARLGLLWCRGGRWGDRQVVPEAWLRETTVTAPDILTNCTQEQWCYGHGFWTNDQSKLWADLPRSGFTAAGAGGHYCTVFPEQDLVVVQNPGPYHRDFGAEHANPALLSLILAACD
jgi:CubicO group peptidase (beta-lactamase class C family)